MEERTDEEWKTVTGILFAKPEWEDVKNEMVRLHSKKEGKRMTNISKYYFFEERTKARQRTGIPFHKIIEDKDTYNHIVAMTLRYFPKYFVDDNGNPLVGDAYTKRLAAKIMSYAGCFKDYLIPCMFPIDFAMNMYRKYNFNGKVFDYSCGWGNRLIAAMSLDLEYTGVDTNGDLVNILRQCASDFNSINGINLPIDIRNCGSEHHQSDLENRFGLCFSSPPYFDTEVYNGENTSTNLHSTYDNWVKFFLKPTIENCKSYLVQGGYMVMNIKNMGKKKMFDDAKRICNEVGLKFVCDEKMEVNRRTVANNQKTDRSASDESTMVFRRDDFNKFIVEPTKVEPTTVEPTVVEEPKKVDVIDEMEVNPKYEQPRSACKKELIIDDFSDIDLKSLAVLMVELKKKKVDVRVVHGQFGSNDIVNVLSSRLGIECIPLRDGSNNIIETYCGKNKIVSLKQNEKPVFEMID